ncbi:dihydrofolate reductase family protein [Bdellovibrio sp. HCB337]|uniref:dihydrofolate reductase family protein n=1 Tax=Bdellovibrio sp. HCB337 TaxID=3394358 RepID=UPI0039A496B9
MRKVQFCMLTSLDGYFEGLSHNLDWHYANDEEHEDYANELLNSADLLVFGRKTYDIMAAFWPTANADEFSIARKMNELPKIVFSNTLSNVGWNNTKLIKGDAAAELAKLKQTPGKNIVILGSNQLATSLLNTNIIDEYQIFLCPISIGAGTKLFHGTHETHRFILMKTKVRRSGLIELYYRNK